MRRLPFITLPDPVDEYTRSQYTLFDHHMEIVRFFASVYMLVQAVQYCISVFNQPLLIPPPTAASRTFTATV